mgnify:CR=1 FL=1
MLGNLICLLPTASDSDGGSRHRGRRHQSLRPVQPDAGQWIWLPGGETSPNSYIYARKTFDLSAAPTSASLRCSADSAYKLFVNGRYVGVGPVRSGIGHTYYDTYDVAGFLNKGANVLAFLVHYVGENTLSYAAKRPGLICRVEIEAGNESVVVATDQTWKVRRADDWTSQGARIGPELGFQEVYDAAGAIDDWNQVSLREKDWQEAAVVGAVPSLPWGELWQSEAPALAEERFMARAVVGLYNSPNMSRQMPVSEVAEFMAAHELAPLKAGSVKAADALLSRDGVTHVRTPRGDAGVSIVLDFGREVSGSIEVGIAGSGAGVVDLGYSELLEGGQVKPNRGGLRYTDRVVLRKGRLRWRSFGPRALRYIRLDFRWCAKPVALEYVRVNQTHYPVKMSAGFDCSDQLLVDVWKIGAYTTQLCMQDTFIDSPWRARAQWWGHARVASRVAYYAFGDTGLLSQGLRQISLTQRREGSVSGLYPSAEERLVPDFALLWVFSILDYYAFSDDDGLVRHLYPNVRRLLDFFARYVDPDGLLADVPGELFIDRADLDRRGASTALNCLYHQALRVASVIASIAGKPEDSEAYIQAANRLRLLINKLLYSAKRGLYAECRVEGKLVERYSRQTNVLAALFDVPDHYQKSTVLRQVTSGPLPEITTPYFASFLLEALYSSDRHDEALEFIRRRWGEAVRRGSTTFGESFDEGGEAESVCHAGSVCPTRDLLAEYVGIKPVLGSNRFTVAPHPGGLRWASGYVRTKTGPLRVEWRTTRNTLTITVIVPQDLRVDVYPPLPPGSSVSVDGKPWPSKFVTLGHGEHRVRVTAGRAPKPLVYEDALKPVHIPHVEVLEDIVPRGRRRALSGRMREGIGRRKAAPAASTPAQEAAVAMTEPETEPVERPAEAMVEASLDHKAQDQPSTRRRPRRRGGRGRARSSRTAQPETPEHSEQAAPQVEPAPTAERPPEPSSQEPAGEHPERKRRPRSRRGGYRRRRTRPVGETSEGSASGSESGSEAAE